ncbi:MAG: PSD1 and planctomycete cytochrome C domain-containing protein [Planctomycetia bacterium]|nr:PSD1 and planctomycete cytochrome C domain-containing protein [Planctomycetia bacterium]
MSIFRRKAMRALALAFNALAAGSLFAAESAVRFNRDIRPILSDNCFACHGPAEERGGDLRLDSRADAVEDRGGYAAIVPGKPDESEILRRILSHDADEVMPPPKAKKPKLTAAQIDLLRQWIADGAPYQNHWAFETLEQVTPPASPDSSGGTSPWRRNPIDAFVEARLHADGLAPSPEAPNEILFRRVALDLVGLQPAPEEIAAFVADPSPDAYERAVDRLLASPHYGERWGRHWLDQARYADSNGYSVDSERAMWPYRDWVIDALNRDLPFDTFTIEQLAGDLLPRGTKPQRIATGFHRNTMINQEGGTKPEQFRNEAAVDRVNTTAAVWLGLTAGCAQCHSHKYDPLSHKEYFQLFAFFNSDADVNNVADTVEVVQGEISGTPGPVTRAELDAADRQLRDTRAAASERLQDWLAAWPSIESDPSALANAWTSAGEAAAETTPAGKAKPKIATNLAPLAKPAAALRLRLPAAESDKPFVLQEASLTADGKPVGLTTAFASAERPKFAAAQAVDGKRDTGWSVDPKTENGEVAIVIVPREPVPAGTPLRLTVEFAGGDNPIPSRVAIDATAHVPLAPLASAAVGILADAIKASRSPPADDGPKEAEVLEAFAAVDLEQHAVAFDRGHLRRRAVIGDTMVMKMLPKPRETFVHLRGDYLSPDTKLGPLAADTPAFLPPMRPAAAAADSPATRLELAKWLVRPDNPLTPRVTVNRVWMRYFGSGLVETENDFGTQGTPPTHPELLDWLAGEFIRGGWSMKKLHKLIVTSATYRQSSVHRADLAAKDPRNLLLGRQNRVRLDAEVIRDTALVAAGLFCGDIGGPSVHPPQPAGVYAFTQAGKDWPTDTGPQRYRRSLYTMFYRSAPHPLFTTFDAPNFSTTCTRRIPSNTPLQSLMLANDPIFIEATAAIGDRVLATSPAADAPARIDTMFRLCVARPPTAGERQAAEDFLHLNRETFPEGSPEPWRALARGILNTDAFVTRE